MRPIKAVLIFSHIILGLILLVLTGALWNPRSKAVKVTKAWWLGRVLRLLNMDVEVSGDLPTPKTEGPGRILVSNHVSWLDIPLIGSLQQINFLSKAEVKNWPLIGTLAEGVGTLFIQRGSGDANMITKQIADRVEEGHSVLFFPEGTTTDGSSVKGFHKKLFKACDYVDCEFQPVVINYEVQGEPINPVAFIDDDEFAEHLWHLLSFSHIKARIEFLPVRKFSSENLKQQVQDLEQEMRRKVEVRSRKINLTPNGEEIPSPASA
ncbi:MAG: 1-acyl-sn-glycerol-3-phosphate acyltransferase [Pseudomonadales bacterium]|nr:1-acyl-sn-glycerol-3-phosphate acyltransferase [Pseudomonadales bacterium]